eukprot:622140-Pleurochrysis_carterae.AAC.1
MLRGLAIAQMWRTARSKLHLDRSHADQHLLGQVQRKKSAVTGCTFVRLARPCKACARDFAPSPAPAPAPAPAPLSFWLSRAHASCVVIGQALSSFTNWALLLLRNTAEYLDQIHGSAELHGTETEIVLTRIRVDALKLLDEILQLEGMDRNNGEVDWPPAPAQATELILRGARSQLEHVEHAQ